MLRSLLRGGSRFPPTVKVSMLVAGLTAAPALAVVQEAGNGPRFEGLKRLDLPQRIARAADVRWLDDGEVALGAIGEGIHAWRPGADGAELRVALEAPAPEVFEIGGRAVVNRNTFERDYGRLGVSPRGLAFADMFGGLFVASEDGIDGPVDIQFLGDLDRHGDLTAAVGLMLKDTDGWAPYAAWLIEDGGGPPRGLLPTRDGGRDLELCRDAELSVIRFVSEDRLLVIPGAEAGVFVYDLDGAIRDSLDAATFLAGSGCDVEAEEWDKSPLSDAYVRADWLGPRRLIDEVVADGAGNVYFFVRYGAERPAEVALGPSRQERALGAPPALVGLGAGTLTRSTQNDLVVASVPPPTGRVCWDLVHARVDDLRTVAMRPCVIESEYADTRLRADLRGDRAVILLRGGALRGGDVRAADAFEARIRPPAGSGD